MFLVPKRIVSPNSQLSDAIHNLGPTVIVCAGPRSAHLAARGALWPHLTTPVGCRVGTALDPRDRNDIIL